MYPILSRKIQGELEAARQCVHRLESYLGGELPEEGLTWRDERTALLTRISVRHLYSVVY